MPRLILAGLPALALFWFAFPQQQPAPQTARPPAAKGARPASAQTGVESRLARHRNLGKAFFENPTTHNESAAEFRKALDLDPASTRDRLNYGLALLAAGKTAAGIAEVERVQKQDPALPHTWFNLGVQYKKAGDYERATRQFEQMVKLVPGEPISHYNLGVLYKFANRLPEAGRSFETASRLNPNLAAPHFQLYNLYRQQNLREEAVKRLELFQAVKKQNENAAVPEDMEWSFYSEIYEVVPPSATLDPPPLPRPNYALGDANNDGVHDSVDLSGPALLLSKTKRVPLPAPAGRYAAPVWLDYDHDYDLDLLLLGERGALLQNRQDAGWSDQSAQFPFAAGQATAAAAFRLIADTKGMDIAVAYAGRPGVLYRDRLGGNYEAVPLDALPAGAKEIHAADLNHDGAIDLFTESVALINTNGAFRAQPLPAPEPAPGAASGNWILVELEGVKNPKLAEGSEVEIKAGTLYRKAIYRGIPLRFALGTATEVDQLRITWPNGLIQSEARQPVNRKTVYREAQRLSGSCPQVFTWNGREFEYITDVLGVAPLGASSGDGQYFATDDEEAIVIPGRALQPRQGRYHIRLTEELSEVAYLDRLRLLAVDHPPDVQIAVNEKFQAPPYPPLAIHGLRLAGERLALHTPTPGVTELELAPLQIRRPMLILRGWVDWDDGSAFRAAAQRGRPLELPKLEALAGGRWTTVEKAMGIPAGKPKTVVVDLADHLPRGATRLRISTNLKVHWEWAQMAEETPRPAAREIPAPAAALSFRGFSRLARYSPEEFLYPAPLAASMWNPTPGNYTRYGDVAELTASADDRYVIMGSGDELALEFEALPPPAPGLVRDFILIANGWAKDRDPNTAHSQTVEPLPFRGMSRYPYPASERFPSSALHEDWRRRYNTRPALRLLRPLRELTD